MSAFGATDRSRVERDALCREWNGIQPGVVQVFDATRPVDAQSPIVSFNRTHAGDSHNHDDEYECVVFSHLNQ